MIEFLVIAISNLDLIVDSILHLVEFWAGNISHPLKHEVEVSMLSLARKKGRGATDGLWACVSSCNGAIAPTEVRDPRNVNGISIGDALDAIQHT